MSRPCITCHNACPCREAATRDQARRAALEEAIVVCGRWESRMLGGWMRPPREEVARHAGAESVRRSIIDELRALLDAPGPAREVPDPATCPHERVMGGTCSDCAAPVAVNGHEPGCHASGLGPPTAMGASGWTGCGCTPST